MADYARPGDHARNARSMAEQMRRQRTGRPRRGHVPSPTWVMEGQITMDRFFPPALITLDPVSEGDYPEYKRIVAVDGWLSIGSCTINWRANDNYFYEGHAIEGGTKRVVLDGQGGRPEPYIIENGDFGGEFIAPEIAEEPPFDAFHLSCIIIVEVVPI